MIPHYLPPLAKRNENIAMVNQRVHTLFINQLQSLREYYGRRYENILSDLEEQHNINVDCINEEEALERQQKLNIAVTDAAKRSSR